MWLKLNCREQAQLLLSHIISPAHGCGPLPQCVRKEIEINHASVSDKKKNFAKASRKNDAVQFAFQRPGSTSGPTTALLPVLPLFHIFGGDTDSEINSSSAHLLSTKLSGVVDTLERRNVIQKDFDRLERGACVPHDVHHEGQVQGAAPGLG
ncbi:hypothetical protein DUI87_22291 [Hirundo rustica rustica]|uniref:Uncharacterized protein n=1 Tax=Hirundo rustica rustica TaxID=333673 RepID=A0A3M0JK51_HIRRU|nr:hypothetical protein DUI87_22291 [Hirundo rustica rustica]